MRQRLGQAECAAFLLVEKTTEKVQRKIVGEGNTGVEHLDPAELLSEGDWRMRELPFTPADE